MSRSRKRALSLVISLLLLAFAYVSNNQEVVSNTVSSLSQNQPGTYAVIKVDDGDTLTVNMDGQSETVRLIGVDTPELHHPKKPVQCFAEAARRYLESRINNQTVRLEADPLDDNRDLYGRLLRYVYLPTGELLNIDIISEGYGFAYTRFPFIKVDQAVAAQKSARNLQKGLWSGCKIEGEGSNFQTQSL